MRILVVEDEFERAGLHVEPLRALGLCGGSRRDAGRRADFPPAPTFERRAGRRANRPSARRQLYAGEVGVVSGVLDSFPVGPEAEPSPPACRLLVCVGPRCDAEGRGRALLAALREELAADPHPPPRAWKSRRAIVCAAARAIRW